MKAISWDMRATRLLRIVKMHAIVQALIERTRSAVVHSICNYFICVFIIVILNHFLAGGWHFIGSVMEGSKYDSWIEKAFQDNSERYGNIPYRYFTSLHWSLTQLTPASLEVTPRNVYERIYSVIVLLFALNTFSSCESSITQAVTHIRNNNAQQLE